MESPSSLAGDARFSSTGFYAECSAVRLRKSVKLRKGQPMPIRAEHSA